MILGHRLDENFEEEEKEKELNESKKIRKK